MPKLPLLPLALCFVSMLFGTAVRAGDVPTTKPTAAALPHELLDSAQFFEWMDGSAHPVNAKGAPSHVLYTREEGIEWDGLRFGEGKKLGPRYLHIGLTQPVLVESVLTRAGGVLSVLKPDAAYPGNVDDDRQWIIAARLDRDHVTSAELPERDYGIWTLPPGTRTRALRFTHIPQPTDRLYSGWLGGLEILSQRFANVAPQAQAAAQFNDDAAGRINDQLDNNLWEAWDDGPDGAPDVVSPQHPQMVMLSWRQPVQIRTLVALWAGFAEADAQVFVGKELSSAAESDWQTIRHFTQITNQYPRNLPVNELDLGSLITTRAIRLRITKCTTEEHPHLHGNTRGGRRVWLGELMALHPLEAAPVDSAIATAVATADVHPPIPVRFTLPQAGFVTLVIEDAATSKRLRNLISETHLEAGPQTIWWDGLDDLERDEPAAHHGIYHIPGKFVPPGTYRVRGLYRGPIDLRYEFAVYNAGSPAWETADSTGAWLANHTPPSSTLFLPADRAPGGKPLVYLGSYVTEGGHGLAWVDLDGRKQGGRGWIGGNWTGAPYLARDMGDKPVAGTHLYVGAAWEGDLRLTALTAKGDQPVVKYQFPGGKETSALGGIAVRNGLLVATLSKENGVLLIDAGANKILADEPVSNPRGVAFDPAGRLLVLSGHQLLRFDLGPAAPAMKLPQASILVKDLSDPQQITLDSKQQIYISDAGDSHQVKVFSTSGEPVRAIGHPGRPGVGKYDPMHMNNPNGLTIDSQDHLWVAETDFQPKRVSVWTLDGQLMRAFYGPSEYGGGGKLDPTDKTQFYFHGMRFKLDWDNGTSDLAAIFWRPQSAEEAAADTSGRLKMPIGFGGEGLPETPVFHDGKRYFSNCFNNNPTGGASTTFIWLEQNDVARPVASMGRVREWPLMSEDALKSRRPANLDFKHEVEMNHMVYLWSDANSDGIVQPEEVSFIPAELGGITVGLDLSFIVSRLNHRVMQYAPASFTKDGVPIYSAEGGKVLLDGAQDPTSSGGDQALLAPDGSLFLTTGPKPFASQSMGGGREGQATWSYPSVWPGLHASHESPPPQYPGEMEGTTRVLGPLIHPPGEAGYVAAVNGNMGNIYLLSSDGLFISTLFHDQRQGTSWAMPVAQRGMLLNDLTLHDENFWPSITQTPDGNVYLVDGGRSSLVKVEGLPSVRRIAPFELTITDAQLRDAQALLLKQESQRQKELAPQTLSVAIRHDAPTVDGKLDEWPADQFITVDKRGVAAYFDSKSTPYNVQAAVAVSGERLYAAFRTTEPDLLTNSGKVANAPFKTGGALDLMIGADPQADPARPHPVAGDVRLLVTRVGDKVRALVYRPVAPGSTAPVPFASPWRTLMMDRVDDISADVQLVQHEGDYEFSVPLQALGLRPQPGVSIRGDVGVLRGNGFQTTQRAYWNNKATAIVSDVPSEAELTPSLWGTWKFVAGQP